VSEFLCNYCGVPHDDAAHAVEHIIPEVLLNGALKLTGTCRRWNNFFARSFESPVCADDFMRELLLMFVPERAAGKEMYLGEVNTNRGTTEHRYFKNGREELRDRPTKRAARQISISAFDAAGREHPLEISLPFDIVVGATGDSRFLEKQLRNATNQVEAVKQYLTGLSRDPSIDPALHAELQERGLSLRPPKSVSLDAARRPIGPEQVIDDILPKEFPLNAERWVKFYLKIAWCFACARVGRQKLSELGGLSVLEHLQSGALDPMLVAAVTGANSQLAAALFRDAIIDGETTWLWRSDIPTATASIQSEATLQEKLRLELERTHRGRAASHARAAPLVKFRFEPLDGGMTEEARREHRFHELVLVVDSAPGGLVLCCWVNLFGGSLLAKAQLTPPFDQALLAGVEADPSARIDF
jgi:hypothetical protein